MLALAISVAASVGASGETLLERGTYLMQGVVACGSCHTAPGGPFKDKELSGGLKWDEKPFTTYATNITPDRETGIGTAPATLSPPRRVGRSGWLSRATERNIR